MSEPEPESRVGTRFGPYLLKRLLGRGGMGEVYEADDTVKERTVALKLLSNAFSQDPVFRKRMQREARTAGRLQEPHVVPIHDYGEIDGQLYIDMRMIEGIDLRAMLTRFGPLTPPRAVAIVRQIASALDAAHASGVTHRDIKPENILINREDFAYLVDFGIAAATTDEHLTQLGTAIGTWKYMAPERFTDGEVTYRADIYALACVLYECLTGSAPYRTDSTGGLVAAHMMEPIPRPSQVRPGVPTAFDAVIARGMAKNPNDRYASAGDLASAAHDALSAPDQLHAATILRRGQEATLPAPGAAPTYPTPAPTPTPTPAPAPAPAPAPTYPAPAPAPAPIAMGGPVAFAGGPPGGFAPSPGGGGWSGPPQPTDSGKRGNQGLLLVIGALVLLVALGVGGLGIWLITRHPGDTTAGSTSATTTVGAGTSTATSTVTAPSTPAGTSAEQRLLNTIPAGYPVGACKPTTVQHVGTVWEGAQAILECEQNTQEGGPKLSFYGLFPDVTSLQNAFAANINVMTLVVCPDSEPSDPPAPVPWHYTNDPDTEAGKIACGTFKNHSNVVWSNYDKLILNDVRDDATAMADLYTWWGKT